MTPEQCELVEPHVRMARRLARRFGRPDIVDDLEGVALEALCREAIRFTERDCPIPFGAAAARRIRQEMIKYVTRGERSRPWARLLAHHDPVDERSEQAAAQVDDARMIAVTLPSLPPRVREAATVMLATDGTVTEVAAHLDVTPHTVTLRFARARQLLAS